MKLDKFSAMLAWALLGACAAFASEKPGHLPPMGWNSYDAFGDSVTEAEVLANARYLGKKLLVHGWNAEGAKLSGALVLASDHEGYLGPGFVAGFYQGLGQKAVFVVKAKAQGSHRAFARYADMAWKIRDAAPPGVRASRTVRPATLERRGQHLEFSMPCQRTRAILTRRGARWPAILRATK